MVVPLLNLCDIHSIDTKSCLNLPNDWAIAQFLAKFDVVALLQSFFLFPYNENPMGALNIPHSNAACHHLMLLTGGEKIHTCA